MGDDERTVEEMIGERVRENQEAHRRPVLDSVALGVIPSADDRSRNPFTRLRRSRQQD